MPKSLFYYQVGSAYRQKIISRTKSLRLGKLAYKKLRLRIRQLICLKLKWCERSKIISKGKTALLYTVLTSQLISAKIPEWAISGGVLAIFLQANKDFDKLCKCKRKKKSDLGD